MLRRVTRAERLNDKNMLTFAGRAPNAAYDPLGGISEGDLVMVLDGSAFPLESVSPNAPCILEVKDGAELHPSLTKYL